MTSVLPPKPTRWGHLGKVHVGSKQYYGFDEDFVTVNPYLGSDGIKPFIKVAKEEKKGLFILVKTSNPSSGEFQDRLIDGRPLYEWVGEQVAAWGKEHMGDTYSYVGAVVGATYPAQGKALRKIMPRTFILVPGYGAQEVAARIWFISSTMTDWAPSSIPPGESLRPTNRKPTKNSDRRNLPRHPVRR